MQKVQKVETSVYGYAESVLSTEPLVPEPLYFVRNYVDGNGKPAGG